MSSLHLLVLDAYPLEGRTALAGAAGTEAGSLYVRLLRALEPSATVDVAYPADGAVAPVAGVAVDDYDGWLWTGSSLTMWHDTDPRVRRQIDLARQGYASGVPQFGSCWAAQLAAVAAGGAVAQNPRGREFGIARGIELSEPGRRHPMFRHKPLRFDGYTSHADIVTRLPPGATMLAANDFSPVQALSVHHRRGLFWALQYHPEYDLHEVAALARLRQAELVAQGRFASEADARRWIEAAEALHADATRSDLESELGVAHSVLDRSTRTREVRNWLDHAVLRAPAST